MSQVSPNASSPLPCCPYSQPVAAFIDRWCLCHPSASVLSSASPLDTMEYMFLFISNPTAHQHWGLLSEVFKYFPWNVPLSHLHHFPLSMNSIPLAHKRGEGDGTPLQYSCLENPMDGGAWKAAVHGVTKSWTQLNNFTFTFHFPTLEKEMATHSSVLAWRIPGMAEPGRLQSMESHRVGHDWATFTFHFHALEKEMATHSSVLAWRIPGAGEPDRWQSKAS